MNKIALLLLLLPYVGSGQKKDYCSNIVRDVRDAGSTVIYNTPLTGSSGIVSITKTIEDTTITYTLYTGVFNATPVNDAKGIVLELEDGTIIKDVDAHVECTMVDVNKFNLNGVLHIEEGDLEALTGSRIVSISDAGVKHRISLKEGFTFIAYARCLLDR